MKSLGAAEDDEATEGFPVTISIMRPFHFAAALLAWSGALNLLHAQSSPSPELRASTALTSARAAGPLALHAFLERMPKGADLHMHLSGAVYAETFLAEAAEDGLCVNTEKLELVKPAAAGGACPLHAVPAADAFKDQRLYDAFLDAASMRSFVPSAGVSGHDQFFATFGRVHGLSKTHAGADIDEVATRAAAQNEQYLELMVTPGFGEAIRLSGLFGWPQALTPVTTAATTLPDATGGTSTAELAALRDKLLAGGLRADIAADRAEFAAALAERRRLERCGTSNPAPGCAVQVKFLYQVLRQNPPAQVFAQTLLAFEVAAQDPDVVGLNFVQPEDAYLAMSEYHRQMLMLDYLHSVYPQVHISLHAGELAPGMVPPAGLRFHIREAVELGHAERVGHGVDVMYETDSAGLLREMAARHVMVEINLTSNTVILGVSANYHSLPNYLAAGVPVALSTDDEGVSRIDLTHEYALAATTFGLGYGDLKRMARTSIEHTFLPGADLWQQPENFTAMNAACAAQASLSPLTPGCALFLKDSPHAAQEWELERRFRRFEAEYAVAVLAPRRAVAHKSGCTGR